MLLDTILENPIPLLEIKDKKVLEAIDNLLPFSSAFESECFDSNFRKEEFKKIPDIMNVSGGYGEVRFRIPPGLKGLICLYNISIELKKQCELNLGSGNHYHVDCTDIWDFITLEHIRELESYLLTELDTWNYKGTYNSRGIYGKNSCSGTWIRFNDLRTMEYRIGEMTFDCSLLAKRIIHCNKLTSDFKLLVLESNSSIRVKRLTLELQSLHNKLKSYKKEEEDKLLSNINFGDLGKEVIKTRVISI